MLMDQAMNMMERFVKEIKEADPEKREHFVKISTLMFEISKELFAISPEFRKGFAEVHSEFLKLAWLIITHTRRIKNRCFKVLVVEAQPILF